MPLFSVPLRTTKTAETCSDYSIDSFRYSPIMPAINLESLAARSIQGRAEEVKDVAYMAALAILGPLVLLMVFVAFVYRRRHSLSSKKLKEVSADFQKHRNAAKAEEARIQALLKSANAANGVVERENRRLRRMAARLPAVVTPSARNNRVADISTVSMTPAVSRNRVDGQREQQNERPSGQSTGAEDAAAGLEATIVKTAVKSPPSGNSGERERHRGLTEQRPSRDETRDRSSFEPTHNSQRPIARYRSLRQPEPFELGGRCLTKPAQENLPNEATERSEHSLKPTQGSRQDIVRERSLSDPNKARKERLGDEDEGRQKTDLEWDNANLDEPATVWPFQGDDTDLESCYSMGTVLSSPEVNQVSEPKQARIASPTMDQVLAKQREIRVRIVEP
ncbi:hypothetical protein EDB80DRAFT_883025 [Ilyonectria destructans]|nr:hypothetical protein EDB80DRAFT_883025 [Ilyonectria destructans]